jgi:hypothetical protein
MAVKVSPILGAHAEAVVRSAARSGPSLPSSGAPLRVALSMELELAQTCRGGQPLRGPCALSLPQWRLQGLRGSSLLRPFPEAASAHL